MSIFDKPRENPLEDIFGDQPSNAERMARYLAKRKQYWNGQGFEGKGPWVLEYEARGDTFFTSGGTPEDALARTGDKEPDGWMFNNIMTEKEWFERCRK